MTPDGALLAEATTDSAYTNAQINFTINDGATDYAAGDIFTVLATAADSNLGTWTVMAPDGALLAEATTGSAYTNAQINFTINDGTTDYADGDIFTIAATAADSNLGTWTVKAPDGLALPDATTAAAYTNAQINFTINDGTTDFAAGDIFTVLATEADHDAGTFSVTTPSGDRLADATADVAYTSYEINFTINDGSTDFAVDDSFTVAVTADANGYVKAIDYDATDGTQTPYGITYSAYDASEAAVAGACIVRDAQINSDYLAWPVDFTGGGTDVPVVGDTVVGATSDDTAEIVKITVSSGAWADGDAVGVLWLKNCSDEFQAENLDIDAKSVTDFCSIAAGLTITSNLASMAQNWIIERTGA